jgi:mRNA interferase MazF
LKSGAGASGLRRSEYQSIEALRSQLERAAIRDRDLDRDVATDWLGVDIEAWHKLDIQEPGSQAGWPRRGEIYLTTLDPTISREIQKTPNRVTDLTMVAPITSTVRFPLNPVHVLVPVDRNTDLVITSVALLNEIRAIDKVRLLKRLGALDSDTLLRVDRAIQISLGLTQL